MYDRSSILQKSEYGIWIATVYDTSSVLQKS